jgi:hypothetical protein
MTARRHKAGVSECAECSHEIHRPMKNPIAWSIGIFEQAAKELETRMSRYGIVPG